MSEVYPSCLWRVLAFTAAPTSDLRFLAMQINSAKDLEVYKVAYALAMEIFEISRGWPPEEKYSLTDQIRRASRSVCTNLREAGSAPEENYVLGIRDKEREQWSDLHWPN
jgi:hypothetical protein